MTIQAITGLVSVQVGTSLSGSGTQTIDASGEKSAVIAQAPKTGNVTAVHWATNTVTTGGTVDVRIETFSSATGFPSGALWSTTTNGSQVVAAADDMVWFKTALTSAAAVTRGDIVCVLVVAGSPGNMQILCFTNTNQPSSASTFPRGALYTTSWSSSGGTTPIIYFEYDTGDVVPLFFAAASGPAPTTVTINTGTTPDEIGNYFTSPITGSIAGAVVGNTLTSAAADFDLILYDSSNTVLATVSTVSNQASTAYANKTLIFATAANVSFGDVLRLVVKPTTANSANIFAIKKPVAGAHINGVNSSYCRTERTDAGAWAETTTEVITLTPIFSGFDDGAGGGGGGGMRIVGGGLCG
jgi:hypothetical protein